MEVLVAYPPNIKEIEAVFDLTGKKPFFAYGRKLYNPFNSPVDVMLMAHETTHQAQQGSDPKSWWDRYLSDNDFRLSQEIEAYQAQYKALIRNKKDGNKIARYVHQMACDLAGPLYGNLVTYSEAMNLIKYGHR